MIAAREFPDIPCCEGILKEQLGTVRKKLKKRPTEN